MVDITGSVLHGPSIANYASADPREPAPKDKPRKFHEIVGLRAAEQGEGMQPKVSPDPESVSSFFILLCLEVRKLIRLQYKIFTQNFRFIG